MYPIYTNKYNSITIDLSMFIRFDFGKLDNVFYFHLLKKMSIKY